MKKLLLLFAVAVSLFTISCNTPSARESLSRSNDSLRIELRIANDSVEYYKNESNRYKDLWIGSMMLRQN